MRAPLKSQPRGGPIDISRVQMASEGSISPEQLLLQGVLMDASQIGKRAWSYAGVLQDAGLSCFEYVEQLTLLLFLKMADQQTEPPYNRKSDIPADLSWKALLPLDGAALEDKYRE